MNWLCRTIGHKWAVKLRYRVDGIRAEELRPIAMCVRCGTPIAKVWICGKLTGEWVGSLTPWEVQGVYGTESGADTACRDESYFIFPATMGEELPHDSVMCADGRYPRAEAPIHAFNLLHPALDTPGNTDQVEREVPE